MSSEPSLPADAAVRRRTLCELGAYFGLAFAITWGLGAALLLARRQLEAVVGPIGDVSHHWLYFLAVYAPTISAVVCSLAFGGWGGLKALAGRFVRPVRPVWIAVAVLAWPAAIVVLAFVERALGLAQGQDLRALALGAPMLALTTTALLVDPGGLGEETGWRGYALPRLVTLMRPAWAGLLLGVVWGVWHLPAFFVSDLSQSKFGFGVFLAAAAAFSVVMAWLYVQANGNVLVAGVIPHLVSNLLFDAHVYRSHPVEQETIALATLALVLIAVLGPDLKSLRWARAAAPA